MDERSDAKLPSCSHAPCVKCGKGHLLPFFNDQGVNVYVCTNCKIVFGCKFYLGHAYGQDNEYRLVSYFER